MDIHESVELRELRVFLVLAEELHFGRTAERLHMTSSRVSQVLRSLERKLGGQLVHRTSRCVALTALGEQFREEVSAAHAELVGVLQRTRAVTQARRQRIRVGALTPLAAGPQFFHIVRGFEVHHPECVVEVGQLAFEEQFGELRRGAYDLVATWLPHGQPDLVVGPTINREPRVLAVAADHPLAMRGEVSLEEIADYRVVRVAGLAREFHEAWVPSRAPSGRAIPCERFDKEKHGDLGQMLHDLGYRVAAGRLVHPTVPSIAKLWGHLDVVYVPIADMPPLHSALVWHRGHADRMVREFVRVARDLVRATSGSNGDPAQAMRPREPLAR